jgi:hypothetical protein
MQINRYSVLPLLPGKYGKGIGYYLGHNFASASDLQTLIPVDKVGSLSLVFLNSQARVQRWKGHVGLAMDKV